MYKFFSKHKPLLWSIVTILTIGLAVCAFTRLSFNENITDFLPIDKNSRQALQVSQKLAGDNKIAVIFEMKDTSLANPDLLDMAADAFGLPDALTMAENSLNEHYSFIPYQLNSSDWQRIDSLLSIDGYIDSMLIFQRNMLAVNPFTPEIPFDPLCFFPSTPSDAGTDYEIYGSHIFSSDLRKAFLFTETPYGSSETMQNGILVDSLRQVADSLTALKDFQEISITIAGAPVIAVENARKIKHDSFIAIAISVILILLLLYFVFHSLMPLLQILITISFSMIFALGILSFIHTEISLIVIGISSVIIGIAVNYPLHYIYQLQYDDSPETTLSKIIRPLTIGNITTIAAFLTLVPLHARALSDLGLYSALILLGTILFTIFVLPHFPVPKYKKQLNDLVINTSSNKSKKLRFALIALLTITTGILAYCASKTEFDSNLSHINYISSPQRQALISLSNLRGEISGSQVYCIMTDSAAEAEQTNRINRWNNLTNKHPELLTLNSHAEQYGFSANAFAPFETLIKTQLQPLKNIDFIALNATQESTANLSEYYATHTSDTSRIYFDFTSLNSRIAEGLQQNFDYIGILCSLIVFIFLWLTFRRLKWAAIAFLPMVIGWIWILGIMQITSIQFNIVNIILATFIFGQGDDYTIFITEGLIRRKTDGGATNITFERSILVSAALMFIGMGTLVIARHPAMFSLGIVTIIGMAIVVAISLLIKRIAEL